MEVIKTGTNIATVKISELPQTTDTSGRSTLATNADNESEALKLTQISEAIDAAAIAQQAATDAEEAAKNANTLAGVARTAASNAEAAAEDAQTARNSAETAAATAQQAATDAEEAAEGISQDLTGKADLDANKKYLLATQLDPTTGYQTGAIMGKGWFSSEDEALCLKDKDQTIILTFVTGNKAGGASNIVYREFSNYDLSAAVYIQYMYSTKQLAGLVRGPLTLNRTVQPNTLVSAALSYHSDGRCVWFLNGVQVYDNTPTSMGEHNPTRVEIGGGQDVCETDNQIISLRKFDFAMTTEQLKEAWNNGHPELWRVPDEWRYGIESARCILDLNPKGLLPTVWRDTSGHGNNLPYSPPSGNPDTCELSYENHGFPDVITGTAAPTVIPNFVGQRFIDTTNKVTYTAYGTTSAGDWKQ